MHKVAGLPWRACALDGRNALLIPRDGRTSHTAHARLFDRDGIELAIAAGAARIMHYLQLLFPLQRKSKIYRLHCSIQLDGNPSVLSQRRQRIR